jgi:hypothetical protein
LLNSFEIKSLLLKMGFDNFKSTNKRIDGFNHPDLDSPIYLKTTNERDLVAATDSPVVIHSKFKTFTGELGITSSNDTSEYFNSNMSGFDRKRNTGANEIYFGIDLDIASENQLNLLIDAMKTGELESFNSGKEEDEKVANANIDGKVMREITVRRGQPEFRNALVKAYDGKCCISGCRVISVLEAAHIIPHAVEVNYGVLNGLLLRADLHTLYDLNQIGVNGKGEVVISNSLVDTEYGAFKGKVISADIPDELRNNLTHRFEAFEKR